MTFDTSHLHRQPLSNRVILVAEAVKSFGLPVPFPSSSQWCVTHLRALPPR